MEMLARDIMIKDVKVVHPHDSIEDVAQILMENGISGLPVVNEEQELVGIITEGDLIFQNKKITPPAFVEILGALITLGSQEQYFKELKRTMATSVEQLMEKDVITANPADTVQEVATLMVDKKVNRLPVVEGKTVIGIITRQDLIRAVHKNK